MAELVCAGDINVDIITEPIDKVPKPEQQKVVGIGLFQGGEAGNCAACASSLGLETHFYGRIGNDNFGDFVSQKFLEYRLEGRLARDSGHKTGVTLAITYKNGKRSFLTDGGANEYFSVEDIDFDVVKRAKHLHRGGFWHGAKMQGGGNKKIFRFAKDNGVETSLNIGWDYFGWTKSRREMLLDTLENVDVFFLNDKEAMALTGKKNPIEAGNELAGIVKIVALHYGEKGSIIFGDKAVIKVPAYKVKIVNPTGTGDAFNAGFIYGRINGWDLKRTALFANATAAVHLTRTGAYYPKIEQVMNQLKIKA